MDYSTKKDGIKRRKVMSSEVFETPEPEEPFQPYAPANASANASARHMRVGVSSGPEVEGYCHDKVQHVLCIIWIIFNNSIDHYLVSIYLSTIVIELDGAGRARTASHTGL